MPDEKDYVFDPDVAAKDIPNVTPSSRLGANPPVINITNPTGRNATYLAERKTPFDAAKTAANVEIVAGATYQDSFVDSIAKSLQPGQVVNITAEALTYLAGFAKRMKDGYQAAVPMICLDDSCPYKSSCPLHKAQLPRPLMEPCPIETHLFNTWVTDKMRELSVDPNDPMASIDRSQIREYAELEILQLRATLEMADDPATVKEKVVGVDNDGNPIMGDVENPRIGIIARLSRSKRDLLSDLVGTRKERLGAGQKGETAAETVAAFAAGAKNKYLANEKKRLESKTGVIEVDIKEVKE